jgi:uncharacterized protein RhaS with RHS repeats
LPEKIHRIGHRSARAAQPSAALPLGAPLAAVRGHATTPSQAIKSRRRIFPLRFFGKPIAVELLGNRIGKFIGRAVNGLSTSTFSYDNDGNLTQKTIDGTTTTYVYDYANRLTALGVSGATTTYGYDAFGTRVLQTGTTTTTIYPFKWYSVASSTGSGAKYATTTDYVFNGDTLLSTVDQQTASGVATGTAKTRYVHPDHHGSTNVVTE